MTAIDELREQLDTAKHNRVRNAREYARLCHENDRLRELVRDLYGLAWPECPGAAEAYLPRIQSLGVEVDG